MTASALSFHNSTPRPQEELRIEAPSEEKSVWFSPSAWISFLASALTAFTVSLVGEMPLGEVILIAAAGWAMLCVMFNRIWPGSLLKSTLFWGFLVCQFIALCSYIFSDIYWHSTTRDMARGWGRMVFLAVDIVAVAYLFGCSRRNFMVFLLGQYAGDLLSTALFGPMFGDLWKFGLGTPLTFLVLYLAAFGGPLFATVAALGIGVLHFVLDYRSFGGVCLLLGMLTLLQSLPRRMRLVLAPIVLSGAAFAVVWTYSHTQNAMRSSRSDVERSAMITAALEAFEESPLIGHGSWFSNSRVYDNFMEIRHASAKSKRVGGFADANK
ncbi:MAG TPA: hypothetical protein VKC60_11810, partial [Opitutaceae bacterium]|nr:hypothetical protein [Opitutaceae bacterium]